MENDEAAAASLRALATANENRSKIGRIRALYPEIENAKKAGVSLEKVLETLNEQGMAMSLVSFKTMLHRVRQEVQKATAVPAVKPPASFTPKRNESSVAADSEPEGDGISQVEGQGNLSQRERREKLANEFIKPQSTNPLLNKMKLKGNK